MTTAAWPSWISALALQDGYSEEPETNVVPFKPDVGPPKLRRRTSMANDVFNCQQHYDTDEYDDLRNFFKSTLKDGTLPFTMTHPRTGEAATWQFVEQQVPKIVQTIGLFHLVQCPLRLLSVTALYRLVDYDYSTLIDSDGARLVTT